VVVLDAIKEAIRECRLGGFDHIQQRRVIRPLEDPILEALAATGADDLMIDVVLRPLLVATWLSVQDICCSKEATELRDEMLRAYRRGYFEEKPYAHHRNPESRRPHVADALFSCAAAGRDDPLIEHVAEVARRPKHLQATCREIAVFLTYSNEERQAHERAWSKAFGRAMAIVGNRSDPDGIASLLLHPSPTVAEPAFASVLLDARTRWLPPSTYTAGIDRWIELCAGYGEAVDALVSFAWSCSDDWQRTTALEWLERVIAGRFDRAPRNLLVEWLKELYGRVSLGGDELRRFRRIVDGLVAAGSWALVELQAGAETGDLAP
jgi:hypothetical protein